MPKTTPKKSIALGILPERTGFYLRVAQIKVFKHFDSILGELGVSPAIFSALEILHLNPGITQTKLAKAIHLDHSSMVPLLDKLGERGLITRQTKLAKAIHLDHSSMVPLLDKLGERGLITRQTSTTDRRNKMVFLTDAGRELHALASAKVDEHENATREILTPKERLELIRLLGKLCKGLP